MIIGFENGSVQVFCLDVNVGKGNMTHVAGVQSIRPHKSTVVQLQWSQAPDKTLVSMSTDRNAFIYTFTSDSYLEPLTFIPVDAIAIMVVFAKHTSSLVKQSSTFLVDPNWVTQRIDKYVFKTHFLVMMTMVIPSSHFPLIRIFVI